MWVPSNRIARIAARHGNEEFFLGPSRLSDIETKGVIPNLYRLYSLAIIYRQDVRDLNKDKDLRSDRRDIKRDTKDIRSDKRDLRSDRRDIREDRKEGESKAELRSDVRDLNKDKRDLRNDRVDRRRDGRDFRRDRRGRK